MSPRIQQHPAPKATEECKTPFEGTSQTRRPSAQRYATTAADLAKALGGRITGNNWSARCPAHDDRTPSLSLRDGGAGKVLLYCHAGCGYREIREALKPIGLWQQHYESLAPRTASRFGVKPPQANPDQIARTASAASIWNAAQPAIGTLVETYLASRGLQLPAIPTLRFHPQLKHASGKAWPALIAKVCSGPDDRFTGIHRTYLARDGRGKAPVEPQKMMLGPSGGGAVRLGKAEGVLMVGEGIETCLAAMQATGRPAWAALSTSGLRALELPKGVREVIVLADADEPGEAAARDCALRWQREGRQVRIACPPKGMDFNDLLMTGMPASAEVDQ